MKCRKCGFVSEYIDYCPLCSNAPEGQWKMLVDTTNVKTSVEPTDNVEAK